MKVALLAGFFIFVFLFGMGIWLEFSIADSALAAAVLTVVGMLATWWKMNFEW
jgi:hypothetical protein